jgi:predicted O-methyltransferase YrrM
MFDLYQTVIKQQPNALKYSNIEACRKNLLKNKDLINYTDLGAGSNILNTNSTKKVKNLAMAQLKPARIAQIIYHLVNRFKYKNIIELGTSLGITSSYIASALKENHEPNHVNFYTVEGIEPVRKIALQQFETLKLMPYIQSVEANFDLKLDEILTNYKTLDVFEIVEVLTLTFQMTTWMVLLERLF